MLGVYPRGPATGTEFRAKNAARFALSHSAHRSVLQHAAMKPDRGLQLAPLQPNRVFSIPDHAWESVIMTKTMPKSAPPRCASWLMRPRALRADHHEYAT